MLPKKAVTLTLTLLAAVRVVTGAQIIGRHDLHSLTTDGAEPIIPLRTVPDNVGSKTGSARERAIPAATRAFPMYEMYDGHSVLRCTGTALEGFLSEHPMKIWRATPAAVDIQATEEQQVVIQQTQETLEGHMLQCKPMIANLRRRLRDREPQPMRFREAANETPLSFFDEFRTYAEIVSFLKKLAADFESVAFNPSIGKSVEGRDIPAVRICSESNCDNLPKIYVQGLLHAREWIGGAAALFIAHSFARASTSSEAISEKEGADLSLVERAKIVLRTHELVVVPVVNPDGYVFSWEEDRLWRKNRRENADGTFGVDLNRNFAVPKPWGADVVEPLIVGPGESDNGADETYRGPASFSEPEAAAVRDFVKGLAAGDLRLLGLDLHSYGQRVLRGYGYQVPETGMPVDEALQKLVGDAGAAAMGELNGRTYVSDHAGIGHFIGAGGCDDWMHDSGQMLSYTIELADEGEHGFLLPGEEILPTSREALEGVLKMAETAEEQLQGSPKQAESAPLDSGAGVTDL